jgi:hypothetical protein
VRLKGRYAPQGYLSSFRGAAMCACSFRLRTASMQPSHCRCSRRKAVTKSAILIRHTLHVILHTFYRGSSSWSRDQLKDLQILSRPWSGAPVVLRDCCCKSRSALSQSRSEVLMWQRLCGPKQCANLSRGVLLREPSSWACAVRQLPEPFSDVTERSELLLSKWLEVLPAGISARASVKD